MIRWPAKLTPPAQKNMDRFRETAAAKALEAEAQTWHFLNWSWTTDLPVRLILENQDHHMLTFVLDERGLWTMKEVNIAPHVRTRIPTEDEVAAQEVGPGRR